MMAADARHKDRSTVLGDNEMALSLHVYLSYYCLLLRCMCSDLIGESSVSDIHQLEREGPLDRVLNKTTTPARFSPHAALSQGGSHMAVGAYTTNKSYPRRLKAVVSEESTTPEALA